MRPGIADRPEILATACERDVDCVREQLASPLDPLGFKRLSEDGDEPAYLVDFRRVMNTCERK